MLTFKNLSLVTVCLISIQACSDKSTTATKNPFAPAVKKSITASNTEQYNNTKGFYDNGEIISRFNCPDAIKFFPPINLKYWDKTPAVNGRLPTYEETMNGTAIHHYGEKLSRSISPYNILLPKLAYYVGPTSLSLEGPRKNEIVVVIQIVKTPTDTIVGFRYLSGGCGGSKFSDYRFLTDEEVKHVSGQYASYYRTEYPKLTLLSQGC